MMVRRMSPGNWDGSCCIKCPIFDDDFNRAAPIGSDWDLRLGGGSGWTISSNKAQTTTSDDHAICNTSHPDAVAENWCQATFKVTANGDEVKLIAGYVDDNNYAYILITVATAHADTTVEFHEVIAGVDSQLGPTRKWYALNAFFDGMKINVDTTVEWGLKDDIIRLQYTDNGGTDQTKQEALSTSLSGDQVGFGSGTLTGTLTIDDFSFERYLSATSPSTCKYIRRECAACADGESPDAFQVTLASIANKSCLHCNDFNGTFTCDWWRSITPTTDETSCQYVSEEIEYNNPYCPDIGSYKVSVDIRGDKDGESGDNRYINVTLQLLNSYGANLEVITWREDYASDISCESLSSEAINDSLTTSPDPSVYCDFSSATATITAA